MTSLPVSVVIPTYNRADLVQRALRSVLEQVGSEDEVIVIDDGSTDDTGAALAPFRERIRYRPVPNGGPGRARNLGVREARCPLVAFLDSDDEWMPGKLALQRTLMQARPDLVFTFSDFAHRNAVGREYRHALFSWHRDPRGWDEILGPPALFSSLARLPDGRRDFPVHIGDFYASQLTANYVSASTVVIRRALAGDLPWYPEDLPNYQDWGCFARLSTRGPVAFLAEELAWYHRHTGSQISRATRVHRARCRISVLERVWGSDADFLADHGARFRARLIEEYVHLVKLLVKEGRLDEARRALRRAPTAPLSYRILTALPAGFAREAIRIRRALLAMRRPPCSSRSYARLPDVR